MINKQAESAAAAVADIPDGATLMIGGFGSAGSPTELVHALVDRGVQSLTIISNNAGNGQVGLAALIAHGQVRRVICSYPRSTNSTVFAELYRRGEIELELVPQGTLAERIRAGGAGIPAFFTPTSAATLLAAGKELRAFDGKDCVLEYGLRADYALVKAARADRYGNLVYNKTARNFAPLMCTAAGITIVQVKELVDVGAIDPETVITPAIYVNRLVLVPSPAQESTLVQEGRCYL